VTLNVLITIHIVNVNVRKAARSRGSSPGSY